jgi:hypothetical protein
VEVVGFLLEAGVGVDVPNKFGVRPADAAIHTNNQDILRLIKQKRMTLTVREGWSSGRKQGFRLTRSGRRGVLCQGSASAHHGGEAARRLFHCLHHRGRGFGQRNAGGETVVEKNPVSWTVSPQNNPLALIQTDARNQTCVFYAAESGAQ